MKYYLAPMEGITGHTYRKVLKEFFKVPDKCFTPFVAPNQNGSLKNREKREIAPENNEGLYVVPQILTNHAEDFLIVANHMKELGYQEVNLNLGCPSGTVVSKKRGSGFLSVPEELDLFLEEIFEKSNIPISIKTRLGMEQDEEFYKILEIYNKYPMTELIIHPRVRADFYKKPCKPEMFREAIKLSKHTLCYNGDLFTKEVIEEFEKDYPGVDRIMIGRGLITNPGLLNRLNGETVTSEQIKKFHHRLVEEYDTNLYGDSNVLFKMKELWFYMGRLFPNCEKELKKIKKAQHLNEYMAAVNYLFAEKEMIFTEQLYF